MSLECGKREKERKRGEKGEGGEGHYIDQRINYRVKVSSKPAMHEPKTMGKRKDREKKQCQVRVFIISLPA